MIADIIILLPFIIVFAVYRAITPPVAPGTTTTTAPAPTAAPKVKDQRPLWAQVPMVECVPPRCTAWENEQARIDSRLLREAEAAKAAREEMEAERRLRARLEREAEQRRAWAQEWEPAKLPPPEPRYHRPLKAKGRNWA